MVCYLMLMTYLLFQTVDDARQFLRVRADRAEQPLRAGCCVAPTTPDAQAVHPMPGRHGALLTQLLRHASE
jgi:hypothetical protein